MSRFGDKIIRKSKEEIEREEQQRIEERSKEIASGPGVKVMHYVPRGKSYFMVLPHLKGRLPYRHLMMHDKPFHRCNLLDPVPSNSDKAQQGFIHDSPWSGNCVRAADAFDLYKRLKDAEPGGFDKDHPARKKFNAEKGSQRTILQAVNFTPFFDKKGRINNSLYELHMSDYVKVVVAATKNEPIPENDLPEEMLAAASIGAGFLVVKQVRGATQGAAIEKAYNDAMKRWKPDENGGASSCFELVDKNMLVLEKKKDRGD